jgi:hypothetical protein
MKLTLRAPGTKRLKLKYDVPLSNVAFKIKLRRYTKETNLQAPMSMVSAGLRTACNPKP